MTQFLKYTAYAGIVASSLSALLPQQAAAESQGIGEGQGIVTQLGAHATAVTYWISGPQGWDVVTTIDPLANKEAENDGRAVMRFSSRLLPGQSQTISVPAVAGVQPSSLLIRRVADHIEVETAPFETH
jgi:stage V sporulation protein SpoVS